uniref:Large ribosomal subunit protein uL23c n=1 Tax=Caloglossa intermedia TaxID=100879 RepID=A0A1Z1M6W1_9FLOR|nr:ribosomal protein L23 [Caloglossa intermedia]ARW61494.1 ribosomal protein L23 [Caloglossa intermedia]
MINKHINNQLLNLIKHPVITDKTTREVENNVYVFAVEKQASKLEIKLAIEYIFQVKVKKINTINRPIKIKRVGKFSGTKKQYKKAIVKLNPDFTIDLFNNN